MAFVTMSSDEEYNRIINLPEYITFGKNISLKESNQNCAILEAVDFTSIFLEVFVEDFDAGDAVEVIRLNETTINEVIFKI